MVGASDSHRARHIGEAATRFENRIDNVQDLIREIKADRYRAVSLKQDGAGDLSPSPSNSVSGGS